MGRYLAAAAALASVSALTLTTLAQYLLTARQAGTARRPYSAKGQAAFQASLVHQFNRTYDTACPAGSTHRCRTTGPACTVPASTTPPADAAAATDCRPM